MLKDDGTAIRLFRRLLSPADSKVRDSAAEALRVAANDTEWRRNQPCDSAMAGGRIGCVLGGAVRKYSLRSDGHRQIVDLLLMGDFLGLAPTDSCFSLEAVSNGTRIASFKRDQVKALEEAQPAILEMLRDRAADAIRRLEYHLLVQGRTTAIEKVGGYLMVLCQRLPVGKDEAMVLPVSRYDIADHLGLAVETVSRTMTTLRRCGIISMAGPREVIIRQPAILAEGFA
ncbi:MAG: FixK family transcriptional regulator [Alphaproteobacteria bacterium]|nr:FixK family transcriptional regulator [Alphaproteobacteria bacterium]